MSTPHFSKAADNNKIVILEQLRNHLKDGDTVLEIASGTAQHALYFSEQWPELSWQPSDRDIEEYGLKGTIEANPRANLAPTIQLDVTSWPNLPQKFDAVYSANCLHIIDWPKVEQYIAGAAASLKPGGAILLYGPFKYDGNFTTPSNEQFDQFLKKTYDGGGIRDFEAIDELAQKNKMVFECDSTMPANNQFLVWRLTQ